MSPTETSFADPFEERILRRIPLEVAAVGALFGLAAALLFDPMSGLICLAGGVFSAVSFLWLKRALGSILERGKAKALKAGIALYALRFVLILGVFLLIILLYPRKLIAFAVGFSAVVPVFGVEAAAALIRAKAMKP